MPSDDSGLDFAMANTDAIFIDRVLDEVSARLCVDLARIFVVGKSIGAMGASILACVKDDRIAAIAPIAGVIDVGEACLGSRAVPPMAIHGTTDGIAPIAGGLEGKVAAIVTRQTGAAHAECSRPGRRDRHAPQV